MATDLAEDTDVDASNLPGDGESPDQQEGSETVSSPRAAFQLSRQKLKVIVLLLVVMGVQMAVGYMLLPEPAVSSMGSADEAADGSADDSAQSSIDTVEVSLGSFNPTKSYGSGAAIIHVSFNLTAIVATDNKEPLLEAFKETHGARIRSAVGRVIRSSNLEDLADPKLYVIKRKIREEINKVLQKTYVNEVVLDEIRIMNQ